MKLFLVVAFLLTIFSFVTPAKSFADTSCQPIYGGGQSCATTNNLAINKKVLNPQTNQFADNLGINDPKYQPNFITTFQLTVTNTADRDFSNVKIQDIFPQYVLFSSGPGTFDANTKTLTISADNLKAKESRTFTIMGKVVDSASIPLASGTVCIVNQATATSNLNDVAQDNAQFCIEKVAAGIPQPTSQPTKGGFPVFSSTPITITPSTGPEAFALFSLIPTLGAGMFLRKITNIK